MLNEREMKYRIKCAQDQKVPITNYGILIAHTKGSSKEAFRCSRILPKNWRKTVNCAKTEDYSRVNRYGMIAAADRSQILRLRESSRIEGIFEDLPTTGTTEAESGITMCGICGFVGKVESQGIVLESMMQALHMAKKMIWENITGRTERWLPAGRDRGTERVLSTQGERRRKIRTGV